jgi:hypothetical protein
MSRHFFHLRERGGRLHPDDCGVDLPDAEAAYEEALLGARGLMDDAALARRGGRVRPELRSDGRRRKRGVHASLLARG